MCRPFLRAGISARKAARPRPNVLFGDVNPGGKLPITFPHSVGDLPDFYNHKPSHNRSYEFGTASRCSRSATA